MTNCKERQLFTISYTLAPEKHFLKLCNRSTLRKFDLFCGIEVYHLRDYCNVRHKIFNNIVNCDILQNIKENHFRKVLCILQIMFFFFFTNLSQSNFLNHPKFFMVTEVLILPVLLLKWNKTCCIEFSFVKIKDFC